MHDPSHALLFVDIAERGSIASAAKAHHISRATAARRLAALEESLGVQLITRTTHALSLTSAGAAYLVHARAVREALARAEDAVLDAIEQPQGLLRVAAPIVNHDQYLLPLLRAFCASYPDIHVEVSCGMDVRDLVARGFDVGLQVGLDDNAELTMKRLLIDEVIFVAAPSYLKHRGTPAHIDHLSAHDCLRAVRPDGMPHVWRDADGADIAPPCFKLMTNSHELIIRAALAGMGIAMLPRTLLRAELASGALVHVLPEASHSEWFSLVYSATRIVPPNVRVFIAFTTTWFERLFGTSS